MKLLPVFSCICLSFLPANAAKGQQKSSTLQPVECTFVSSPRHICEPETFRKALSSARTVAILARDTVPAWNDLARSLDQTLDDKEYNRLRNLYFDRYVMPQIGKQFNVEATRDEFRKLTNKSSLESGTPNGVLDREPQVTYKEDAELTKTITNQLQQWGRFKIVRDPDSADLVFDLRKCPFSAFNSSPELPVAWLLVWPRGASPAKDDILWLEKYEAKWPSSDVAQGVFRLLRQHVSQLENHGKN
jgi:hypothetical protein